MLRKALFIAVLLALIRVDVRVWLADALIRSLPDPDGEPPSEGEYVTVWRNGCPL